MAINLRNTNDVHVNGVKILVHGMSGSGKTTLIATLPKPLVLSAEAGLLSIAGSNIDYLQIKSIADLTDAYSFVMEHLTDYEAICLDSISEIAEQILSFEKKNNKDPRAAYGNLQEQMGDFIRSFRDLDGVNVYFSSKTEKITDNDGRIMYAPSLPGNKTSQQLPYFFDEVLALRVEKDEAGNSMRIIQTDADGVWSAKDRSGKLDMWEQPHLGDIINKIKGVN